MIGKLKYFFFKLYITLLLKRKVSIDTFFCFCLRVLYGEILLCLSVYNINISNTCITSIMKNTKNVIAIIFNSLIFRIFFLYEMEI